MHRSPRIALRLLIAVARRLRLRLNLHIKRRGIVKRKYGTSVADDGRLRGLICGSRLSLAHGKSLISGAY